MQVGDLVRETMDGNIGVILAWESDGWLVSFPKHGMVFHMLPKLLEVVDNSPDISLTT
jgi:hypothetical protein